ncbi:MAG TPA: DUF4124 domain-containing protein [Gammaproteobacteria bacterium]|nr:DUF4124 domain-containing protein [Gammaproteobacteria bacterium]
MAPSRLLCSLALAALSVPALCSAQQQSGAKLYRWVDANGEVHYTDSIPPEQSSRDRTLMNNQGVKVGFEEGEITPEERAEINRRKAAADAEERAKAEVQRRDRMLLETYLSVADIEDLRDRRLELLESQIKVTEAYLGNLRKKLEGLQKEAGKFKPYATAENAPSIPENLATEIARTTASITSYEQTLARTRGDQQNLRASFDGDIARFKQLKNKG